MSGKKKIIIIGGGNAGLNTAQGLSASLNPDEFSLQLVTERAFHIHYPAMVRVLVTSEGSLEKLAITPYDKASSVTTPGLVVKYLLMVNTTQLFKPGAAGEVVIGSVQEVQDGLVKLVDGQELFYDWLILASGNKWEGPLSLPHGFVEAHEWINSWRQRFMASREIVVVGGGAVGIELASEIRHFHAHANVTLIQASEELLNDSYCMIFRRAALQKLEGIGVQVLLNDRVGIPPSPVTEVVTLNGVKVKADLVIPTRGGRPNTSFFRAYDSTMLTETGHIRVLPSFLVPLTNGKQNVFAVGDIIAWPEQHMLSKIASHVSVLVPNILNSVKGKPVKRSYSGFIESIILSFGPHRGMGWVPIFKSYGILLGNWASVKLKSKNLFVYFSRKPLGYTSTLRLDVGQGNRQGNRTLPAFS